MDKQGRLTTEHEWVVGARYQWLKGGERGKIMKCMRVRHSVNCLGGRNEPGAVELEDDRRCTFRYTREQWIHRFVKI